MSDKRASVLMVGSVPAETAEDVFHLLGPALGEQLIGMSDGEPGFRNKWIVFNAPHVFEPNPGLEAVNKPKPNRDKSVYKHLEDWVPTSWEEMWASGSATACRACGSTIFTIPNSHRSRIEPSGA